MSSQDDFDQLERKHYLDWIFNKTKITDEFSFEDLKGQFETLIDSYAEDRLGNADLNDNLKILSGSNL